MKSKRAKGLLNSRRRFNEQGTEYHYDDVLDIIEIAEQDAEERAVKAFEEFIDHLGQTADSNREMYHDSEQYVDKFKQLLNGGQSDGD